MYSGFLHSRVMHRSYENKTRLLQTSGGLPSVGGAGVAGATGAAVHELPMTPNRVWRSMQ